MSPEHLEALAKGRERAAQIREQEAVTRVQAFVVYLKASKRHADGSWPKVSMPRIPKDSEWQAAREAGVVS